MISKLNLLLIKITQFAASDAWRENPQYAWLATVFDAVDTFLNPILYGVMVAGGVYAIFLGVNLARAEDEKKRSEAKQRMIWAIIGVVSIFALVLLLRLLRDQMGNILGVG